MHKKDRNLGFSVLRNLSDILFMVNVFRLQMWSVKSIRTQKTTISFKYVIKFAKQKQTDTN